MQNKHKLSDTQPRRISPPKGKQKSTSQGKKTLKDLLTPRAIGWLVFALVLITGSVLLGGWLGYASGQQARLSQQNEQAFQSLDSQFQLGIEDLEAGRYEIARQRFEFIVSQDPNYPGITEKLVAVMEVIYATGTPAPAASITPTPTQDLRPIQELYEQALSLAAGSQWTALIDTISALRKADLTYQAADVDGLLYIALRSRGIEKILNEGNLGGGSYDLALAERFGPLDVDATTAREWARLYMIGLSFWEVYPEQSVFYLSQVAAAAPYLRDSSGWTAMERYYQALIQYGDALAEKEAWCEAASQYELAMSIRAETALQEKFENAVLQCQGATETPLVTETPLTSETPTATFIPGLETPTATATFIPGLETPTPTVTQPGQAPTATATATQPAPTQPVVTDTPTFTPTPTEQAQQPNLTSTPGDGGSQNPTSSLFYFLLLSGLGLISYKLLGLAS